jgi:hypothetical protein
MSLDMKERAELIFSEISPYKGNRFLFWISVLYCILLETPGSQKYPAAVSCEGGKLDLCEKNTI